MSNKEEEVLEFISKAGSNGILQSELWKKMNLNSKMISRIILRLEKKKLIKREKELHAGRWTYRIFAIKGKISLDSIKDCPCASCRQLDRCSPESEVSPETCRKLTDWLMKLTEECEK